MPFDWRALRPCNIFAMSSSCPFVRRRCFWPEKKKWNTNPIDEWADKNKNQAKTAAAVALTARRQRVRRRNRIKTNPKTETMKTKPKTKRNVSRELDTDTIKINKQSNWDDFRLSRKSTEKKFFDRFLFHYHIQRTRFIFNTQIHS